MRHPFDGINRCDTTSLPTKPHRRSVLRWLATASALLVAPLKLVRPAAADDAPAGESESKTALEAKRERVDQFRQFFVVAVKPRGFGMARRKELGIPGSYKEDGWPSRPELRKTPGYVAWMTVEQAEQLRNDPAISAIHEFAAGDTIVSGQPSTGPAEIIVSLYPNGFRDKAKNDSFLTNKELLATLSKELGGHENVQAVTGMKGNKLYIWIKNGDVPPALLTALKENAQVYHVNFTGRRTTMMLGEEGGRPPGNVR